MRPACRRRSERCCSVPEWPSAGGGTWTYVQDTSPDAPQTGETWYDTSVDEGKVYTSGGAWHTLSTQDHGELGGIGSGDHHQYPVPSAGIDTDAVTAAKIAAGAVTASELDGTYPDGSVDAIDLSFDPASQTELDDHAATSGAHHTKYSPPSGIIALWSGAITGIPSGWVLCDGLNGTPNLQDRFVVGAGATYAVDATGGASTHTLTTSELASHTHGVKGSTSTSSNNTPSHGSSSSTAASNTTSAGGDSAHENKPPYYALAYIMKA